MAQRITIGRIVRYVDENSFESPAIVTRVHEPVPVESTILNIRPDTLLVHVINATVFVDLPDVACKRVERVPEGVGPCTWHWPPKDGT